MKKNLTEALINRVFSPEQIALSAKNMARFTEEELADQERRGAALWQR